MHFLGFTSDLAASSEVRALEGRVEDGLPMASCRQQRAFSIVREYEL